MPISSQHLAVKHRSDWDKLIQTPGPLMVLVYASWCPFCLRFLPVFEKIAKEKSCFWMLEDNQEVFAGAYNVEVVPTVLFFNDGQLTDRLDGVLGIGLNERQLQDFVSVCRV